MNTPKIWFTSDNHFGHKNMIKFTNRPFTDVEEMNNAMIERWNARVGSDDIVYHLGDFALSPLTKLREIREKLNGRICLIKGNHDNAAQYSPECFEWIKDYHELIVEDKDAHKGQRLIVLFHYAMRVWNASHHGSWHLYGHSHGELPDDIKSLSFDVGVDSHNFYPLSYEDVKQIMAKKEWKPPFEPRN